MNSEKNLMLTLRSLLAGAYHNNVMQRDRERGEFISLCKEIVDRCLNGVSPPTNE